MFQTHRFWNPAGEPSDSWFHEKDTSYAAGLVLIYANRGVVPEVLLVRQNPNDREKFTQQDGTRRERSDTWKAPIGRFNPFRDEKGILDIDSWDTLVQEFHEETGIVIDKELLMRAPLFQYQKRSDRPGSKIHVDRISFMVTPHRPEPDPEIFLEQEELTDVRWFPLTEMPDGTLEELGTGPTMFSHVRRIIEFLEAPQADNIRWQAGISDDVTKEIRERFGNVYPRGFGVFSYSQ